MFDIAETLTRSSLQSEKLSEKSFKILNFGSNGMQLMFIVSIWGPIYRQKTNYC